jgi:hypothetical protein
MLAFDKLGIKDSKYNTAFCKSVRENIDDLELDFELCECGIAYIAICNESRIAMVILDKIYRSLKIVKGAQIDNIFRYNWNCKYLLSLFQNYYSKKQINEVISAIRNKLARIFQSYKMEFENMETNYLVVFMEALSSICQIIGDDDDIHRTKLLDMWSYLFFIVSARFKDGLLLFKDGQTARIDMIGHFLNSVKI